MSYGLTAVLTFLPCRLKWYRQLRLPFVGAKRTDPRDRPRAFQLSRAPYQERGSLIDWFLHIRFQPGYHRLRL